MLLCATIIFLYCKKFSNKVNNALKTQLCTKFVSTTEQILATLTTEAHFNVNVFTMLVASCITQSSNISHLSWIGDFIIDYRLLNFNNLFSPCFDFPSVDILGVCFMQECDRKEYTKWLINHLCIFSETLFSFMS